MRAVIYREYGAPDVLQLEEVDKPVPRDNELVIKVRATTTTAADCRMRRGDTLMSRVILGARRPRRRFRVMGLEPAGEVEQIGEKVTRFKRGDRVFGFTGFSVGAYAQYSRMPEDGSLALMPEGLTFEEAAAMVDGATTALYFLQERAKMKRGDEVLVIGASGSIGTAAVQTAAHVGARVTAVCSAKNAEMVKALGAARTIDYAAEDFTEAGERYDIIFDTVGKSSYFRCRGSLRERGRYLVTLGGPKAYLQTLLTRAFSKRRCIYGMSVEKKGALREVKRLAESGALRPVIDRRYSLDRMADAHRYVDTGRKRGNVVITVAH